MIKKEMFWPAVWHGGRNCPLTESRCLRQKSTNKRNRDVDPFRTLQ